MMIHTRIAQILFLFALLLAPVDAARAQQDTSGVAEQPGRDDSLFVMEKSPAGAVLRSAILPGWGQFYNESYWKIPVILGLGGYLAWGWFENNSDYLRYSDLYDASISSESPGGNLNYKLYRELYRDRRDTYGWFFGLLYLLQIADAFVDAHLFDFHTDDNHAFSIQPLSSGVRLNFRF